MNQPMMLPRDRQMAIERKYSKHFVDNHIQLEIEESSTHSAQVQHGVELLEDWISSVDTFHTKKAERIRQLAASDLDIHDLVMQVFVQTVYCQIPELFTSVTAQLAGHLGFSDKPDAIATMAEIVAVLCQTDAFDIYKVSDQASMMVRSCIQPSEQLQEYVASVRYLPPMVCEPEEVKSNYHNGTLTTSDSLVLGKGNHHEGDLCLDVINTQNCIPLKLDQAFLLHLQECPNKPITPENVMEKAREDGVVLSDQQAKAEAANQLMNWDSFIHQSNRIYLLMLQQGNRFYLTNKVDKRGRLYSQGYHINTQGTSFKKAMIELADEELVEGVPA